MELRKLAISMALFAGLVVGSHAMASQTVLTFADTATSIVFKFDFVTGEITLGDGANNGSLTAQVGAESFAGTTFSLTDSAGDALNFFTPGNSPFPGVEIFSIESGLLAIDSPENTAASPLLQASFDSAFFVSPFSIGASDVSFNDVSFAGSEALNILGGEGATSSNESFSFALANFQTALSSDEEDSAEGFSEQLFFLELSLPALFDPATATASFTSSADIQASPVPVPAALPLMLSGLLIGMLFGRRKAAAI